MEFEKKLKELEKLVEQMSRGKLSLEEDIKAFEKGVRLSRELGKQLFQAEKKVKQLIGFTEEGEPETKDFEDRE